MPLKCIATVIFSAVILIPMATHNQQKAAAQGPAKQKNKQDQISKITALLKHDNPKVRSAAAFTLGNLGQKSLPALEALILACGDEDKGVQTKAREAVAKLTLNGENGTAKHSPVGNLGASNGKAVKGSYTVMLVSDPQGVKPEGFHTKKVQFQAGTTVTINVKTEQETDIDLYFDDPNGNQIAADTRTTKDCRVEQKINQTGFYSIVVDNLGPKDTKCHITYEAK